MSKKNGLANPTRLKRFDSDDKQMLRVVIETPKGSRNKFAFDAEEHIFELKKVLPAGMTFPYDFGFVPSTKADDGDLVDVLVLMDEPAFAGCVLSCRPIGVIEAEQGDKKDKERNDRNQFLNQRPQLRGVAFICYCNTAFAPTLTSEPRSQTVLHPIMEDGTWTVSLSEAASR